MHNFMKQVSLFHIEFYFFDCAGVLSLCGHCSSCVGQADSVGHRLLSNPTPVAGHRLYKGQGFI